MFPNYKDVIDLIKKGSTIEAQENIAEMQYSTRAGSIWSHAPTIFAVLLREWPKP